MARATPTTVRDAAARAARALRESGIEDGALEVRALLEYVLGRPRVWLLQNPTFVLSEEDSLRLDALVKTRRRRVPLAYLLGRREFFGREFQVDDRVLVPRPETEHLLEGALAFAAWRRASGRPVRRAVDVGTGSGILAISLALEVVEARVLAVDRSIDALSVARANARRLGAEARLDFARSDLLAGLDGPFDLIVANLPYVPTGDLDRAQPELRHEPRLALDGGPDGLDVYRRFLPGLADLLAHDGGLFVEIGADQGEPAATLAGASFPGCRVVVLADLAGRDRVVAVVPVCYPLQQRP